MQLSTLPTILTLLAAVLATPLAPREVYAIGFGEQLYDGVTNSWVAWTEGETPCGATTVITPLSQIPCGLKFNVKGVDYTFTNCNLLDAKDPREVAKNVGVYPCVEDKKKITCSGSIRDVVKHGKCQ